MRKWALAYVLIVMWTCGWIAGRFGLAASFFVTVILSIPLLIAWPMLATGRATKLREYALCASTLLALGATGALISAWIENGVDRRVIFDREYRRFLNHVASTTEYKKVRVSFTYRKGGRVYLHGHVPSKESHEKLLQTYKWMVRNHDSGFYDGVDYPGKPSASEATSIKSIEN